MAHILGFILLHALQHYCSGESLSTAKSELWYAANVLLDDSTGPPPRSLSEVFTVDTLNVNPITNPISNPSVTTKSPVVKDITTPSNDVEDTTSNEVEDNDETNEVYQNDNVYISEGTNIYQRDDGQIQGATLEQQTSSQSGIPSYVIFYQQTVQSGGPNQPQGQGLGLPTGGSIPGLGSLPTSGANLGQGGQNTPGSQNNGNGQNLQGGQNIPGQNNLGQGGQNNIGQGGQNNIGQGGQNAGLPQQLQNLPQQLQNLPQQLQNLPQQLQNLPQQLQNLPQQLQNLPQQLQNLPQQFQNLPQQLQNLPQQFQNLPQLLQNLPQGFLNLGQQPQTLPQYLNNQNPQGQQNQGNINPYANQQVPQGIQYQGPGNAFPQQTQGFLPQGLQNLIPQQFQNIPSQLQNIPNILGQLGNAGQQNSSNGLSNLFNNGLQNQTQLQSILRNIQNSGLNANTLSSLLNSGLQNQTQLQSLFQGLQNSGLSQLSSLLNNNNMNRSELQTLAQLLQNAQNRNSQTSNGINMQNNLFPLLQSQGNSNTLPLLSQANAAPLVSNGPLPYVRIRTLTPAGSVTSVNVNGGTVTPKAKRNRRNKNTYDDCVDICGDRREPICASPLGARPLNPDNLKGFPTMCHMACHNSFRKNAYEKVIDGRCGRLRNRIRTVDNVKLKRNELDKVLYTVVQQPDTIVQFTPMDNYQ